MSRNIEAHLIGTVRRSTRIDTSRGARMKAILSRMSMGRWVAGCLGIGCVLLGGCSVEEGGSGADCIRSTECQAGLVCIEGVCSDDLSAIEDPGEVPELMPEGGMDMMVMPDASEMTPADAGGMEMMMPTDAALPADGG